MYIRCLIYIYIYIYISCENSKIKIVINTDEFSKKNVCLILLCFLLIYKYISHE